MRRGREAIVKAAIRVFAQKGYAGASVREICSEAGVGEPKNALTCCFRAVRFDKVYTDRYHKKRIGV
jgi:DNA-binding transcriptional regulator YbjK